MRGNSCAPPRHLADYTYHHRNHHSQRQQAGALFGHSKQHALLILLLDETRKVLSPHGSERTCHSAWTISYPPALLRLALGRV